MADFDYIELTLQRGAAARRAFVERAKAAGLPAGRAGLFVAQLGWEAAQMALLAQTGVWEASRDPSPTARKAFVRRHELTLSTRAASTLLVAP